MLDCQNNYRVCIFLQNAEDFAKIICYNVVTAGGKSTKGAVKDEYGRTVGHSSTPKKTIGG